jgi:IS5 family transposase
VVKPRKDRSEAKGERRAPRPVRARQPTRRPPARKATAADGKDTCSNDDPGQEGTSKGPRAEEVAS